jgi:hypothetical protein
MDFNEYQMLAEQTAIYDNDFYPIALMECGYESSI